MVYVQDTFLNADELVISVYYECATLISIKMIVMYWKRRW